MTLRNSSGVLARRRVGGADAGVVDEDVDAPELLDGGVDERLAVLGLGDVGGDRDRAAARRLDELLGLLELLDAPRAERDVGAGLSQRLGERHPEAGRGAGDDRDLVVQPEPVQDSHARGSYPPRPRLVTRQCPRMGAALGCGALAASSLVIGALLGLARDLVAALVGIVLAFGAGALISAVSFDLVEEGSQARRPRHGRARARGRRARLLRGRPRRSSAASPAAGRRSRSAPSSTASRSRWCSASASPPARASASGCWWRSSSRTCRRRSARPPTCAPRATAPAAIRRLWIAVAVDLHARHRRRLRAGRHRLRQPPGGHQRLRGRRAAGDADRLDDPRGEREERPHRGAGHRARVRGRVRALVSRVIPTG